MTIEGSLIDEEFNMDRNNTNQTTPVYDITGTCESYLLPMIALMVPLGLFIIISIVILCKFRYEVWSLCSCCLRCRRRNSYESLESESYESLESESYPMDVRCNRTECKSRLARSEKEIKDLGDELKNEKDTIRALEEDLRKERDGKDDALKRLSRSEKKMRDLGDELKDKKDNIRALEADLKKEKDDKDDSLKRLSRSEKKMKDLEDELKDKEDNIRALEADLKKEKDDKDDSLKRLTQSGKEIKDLGDELKDKEVHNRALEADLRKEKDEKDDALKRLAQSGKEIKDLGDELKDKEDKTRALEADLKKERDEKDDALKRLDQIQDQLRTVRQRKNKLQIELMKEQGDKDDVLKSKEEFARSPRLRKPPWKLYPAPLRSNARMSSRSRNESNIVEDLSDPNRSSRIGEQFTELYDNQWTYAYTAMKDSIRDTEHRVISILVEILEECFRICKTAAADQLSWLRSNVTAITRMVTETDSKLSDDLMKKINQERKIKVTDSVPEYQQVAQAVKEFLNRQQAIRDTSFIDNPIVEAYIKECIKLCYLMVNQDPPMAIVSRPDQYAGENFKAYQHRGSRILFVVWPALYLQEGGPLVSRGVAEFGD